ncbi:MAG: hypothetical protein GWO20_18800 [Candidatus Korarchaeota archaeon]|nr:hypothetical protein [Candidatus Korarchaeota archaeon]
MSILEGASKEDIDKKFDVVLESLGTNTQTDTTSTLDEATHKEMYEKMSDEEKEKYDNMSDEEKKAYMEKYKEKMNESKTQTQINENETKTSTTEVDGETRKKMNESDGDPMMEQWKKMIREGKF